MRRAWKWLTIGPDEDATHVALEALDARTWSAVWWALAALAVIRVWLALVGDFTYDEAYYFAWAQHPSLSYLDHPPAIAYLMTSVVGWAAPSAFLARLPVLLLAIPTVLLGALLARDIFGRSAAAHTMLLFAAVPVMVSSFLLVTPDAPLLATWMASVYTFRWAVRGTSSWRWVVFGTCLGMCMLSKYMAVLFLPAMVVFLFTCHRHLLRSAKPYLAMVVSGVVFLPVLVWNHQRDWASFRFQLTMGARHGTELTGLLSVADAVVGQSMAVTPLILVGAGLACHATRKRLAEPDHALLFWFCVVPLTFMFCVSWMHTVEANWMSCGWMTGIPLMAAAYPRLSRVTAWLSGVGLLIAALYVSKPFLPARMDFTAHNTGWSAVATAVDQCARQNGLDDYVLLGQKRYEVVQIPFNLARVIPARQVFVRDRYEYQPEALFSGKDALMVGRKDDLNAPYLQEAQQALGMTVVGTCSEVSRRHVNGELVDVFAIYVLQRNAN